MVEQCRGRLRVRVPIGEATAVRRAIVLGSLVPLVRYLQASLGVATFQALTAPEVGEIVFEFVEVILRRTHLQSKFKDVFNVEAQWKLLCDSLLLHARSATNIPAPSVDTFVPTRWIPYWRRRRCLAGFLMVVGAVGLWFVSVKFGGSGRNKLLLASVFTSIIACGITYWMHGWETFSLGMSDDLDDASGGGECGQPSQRGRRCHQCADGAPRGE